MKEKRKPLLILDTEMSLIVDICKQFEVLFFFLITICSENYCTKELNSTHDG